MPDRYGENEPADMLAWLAKQSEEASTHAEREAADAAEGILRTHAINNCFLCDDEGYRGAFVCDHVDRAAIYRRGMENLKRTMGWTK